jgi:hypothetical protein
VDWLRTRLEHFRRSLQSQETTSAPAHPIAHSIAYPIAYPINVQEFLSVSPPAGDIIQHLRRTKLCIDHRSQPSIESSTLKGC